MGVSECLKGAHEV